MFYSLVRHMNRAFLALHTIAVSAALALCSLEVKESFGYAGHEPFAFTYERTSVAVLCGAFAVGQLFLVFRERLKVAVAVAFYPLGAALALATSLVARGSGKAWAPASPGEALMASLVGYSTVALLVAACAGMCVWSYQKGRRST